ncbi:c3orf15 protein [Toxoplasma gondii p89]|uniref:Cilia- and flagella-associated protein 91 n=1 Tax=Toxoplasma gondii p89 TaxID=943119 RepID=A0A086KQI0_TOXGO|nr:c3orf15 protein [Toxoplasma gondii p89]
MGPVTRRRAWCVVRFDLKANGDSKFRSENSSDPGRGQSTIGIQSVYSERETQTVPYSPTCVVPAGHSPEELTIAHLCWEKGLPATQLEISIVQRMRQKRKIEKLLPPSTDEYSFQARASLMKEQEFREWADRERRIKELHDRRLELVRLAIKKRRELFRNMEEDVLERTRMRLSQKEAVQAIKTDAKRIKALRRMWQQRVALDSLINPQRWKAVSHSTKRASDMFAPRSMKGYIPGDPYASLQIDAPALQFIKRADTRTMLPGVDAALEATATRLRQEAALEQAERDRGNTQGLEAATAIFQLTGSQSHTVGDAGVPLKKYHIRNIRERPETPRVEEVLPEDEAVQVAAILLQRMLRGQTYQQRMFAGKQMRLDLINFLRASEQLNDAPVEDQQAQAIGETTEEAAEVLMASMQGQAIAETLDELAKELRKVEEERRIAVMVNLAERDRRMREAQESGTRQAEELLRAREDETFNRVMSLHHQTVDSYIEGILTASVEQAAKQQALVEAKLRAEQLSEVVDELEERYSNPTTIARELVTSFLLPHVQKQQLQRQLHLEQEKYSIAARYAIGESFQPLKTTFGPLFY